MPFSRITYVYSGQPSFAVNFTLGYLSQSHVTCRVNNEVDGGDEPLYRPLTWLTAGTVQVGGDALVDDDVIVFERTTPKDELQHDYQDGSLMIEENLDQSFLQALMIAHEALDGRLGTVGDEIDMGNNKITNLAEPTDAQDAATKNYIDTFEAINTTVILSALALAEQWAEEDEDTEVESGAYSAKHHALKAAASAAAAAISAGALPQNNFVATTAPTITDDSASGYSIGSRWVDVTGDESYICVDATETAAVWLNSSLTTDELGSIALLNGVDNDQWNSGGEDLAIENGGTGASSASAARTNLNVYSKGEVDTLTANTPIQRVRTEDNSYTSGTVTIPFDDTIPQDTEGYEFLSVAITPSNSANKLIIKVHFNYSCTANANYTAVALFEDGSADALQTVCNYESAGNAPRSATLEHEMVAGGTSEITFSVRAGSNQGSSVHMNGHNAARRYGGSMISWIEVLEVAP